MPGDRPDYGRHSVIALSAVLLSIAGWLIGYSQTRAFVWDEGFHLIAADRIAAGKIPYIDFCFPQTPLNAYLNSALIRLFGEHWQPPHLVAALFVTGAAALAAEFVFSRLPMRGWNVACAASAAVFIGFNSVITQFGLVGQAYGICLLLSVAAFRTAIAAVDRRASTLAFCTGLLAGAAADSSLLTAPVAPILFIWMLVFHRAGTRVAKCAAFLLGVLVSFLPVLWLFAKAPRQVFFNVVQYQALYRRVNWPGATLQDVDALSSWMDSTQALLLGLLAVAGIIFLRQQREWNRARRAEFYLTGWLAVGLGLFIATAHPTFGRYFLLLVPFVSMMAAVGLYSVGTRLAGAGQYWRPAAVAIALTVLACARAQFEDRDSTTWKDYGEIARKVGDVTPPGARLYAEEVVYFLLQRTPPGGMEFSYSHKIQLSPEQEALFHIVSEAELKDQIKAGRFATVESCKDDAIDYYRLAELFPHRADIQDCGIFWGKVKSAK